MFYNLGRRKTLNFNLDYSGFPSCTGNRSRAKPTLRFFGEFWKLMLIDVVCACFCKVKRSSLKFCYVL